MKSKKICTPLIMHLDGIDVEQIHHGQLIITDKLKFDDMDCLVDGQCSVCKHCCTQYTTIGGFSYKYC